jgi:hypothetical protein
MSLADEAVGLLGKDTGASVMRRFLERERGEMLSVGHSRHCRFPAHGVILTFDMRSVSVQLAPDAKQPAFVTPTTVPWLATIELALGGADGYGRGFLPFRGPLPQGLEAWFTREDVVRALGKPIRADDNWTLHQGAGHLVQIIYANARTAAVVLCAPESDRAKSLLRHREAPASVRTKAANGKTVTKAGAKAKTAEKAQTKTKAKAKAKAKANAKVAAKTKATAKTKAAKTKARPNAQSKAYKPKADKARTKANASKTNPKKTAKGKKAVAAPKAKKGTGRGR